jgi:cytochrome c-type biogenesis protein CcmH/NrfF
VDSLVQSYGESILASPPTSGFSLLAWLIPPLALLLGAAAVVLTIRSMRGRAAAGPAAAAAGRGTMDAASVASLPFDLVDRELGEDAQMAEER